MLPQAPYTLTNSKYIPVFFKRWKKFLHGFATACAIYASKLLPYLYIYRLIQYTYIQDDTYTHRYASTSILHIGWYSYTLIHILAFKIHFAFAFFADYTLIHIFKPIHTHYTLRYASTSIYLYADTVSNWYIYLALKIHLVYAFFAVYSGIDSYTLIHIFKPIHTH